MKPGYALGDPVSAMMPGMPEGLEYVPFYCEENVWRLLSRPELAGLETWLNRL